MRACASHVGCQQVELFFGLGAKAPDRQIASQQHDGEARRSLNVDEVAVEPAEFEIAAGHLLVDGCEFFVCRLKLFFRCLQLLVDAL